MLTWRSIEDLFHCHTKYEQNVRKILDRRQLIYYSFFYWIFYDHYPNDDTQFPLSVIAHNNYIGAIE